jgi:hypothetical protein
MTVKLLSIWGRQPAGTFFAADVATEAAMIAAKVATATLTGGVPWLEATGDARFAWGAAAFTSAAAASAPVRRAYPNSTFWVTASAGTTRCAAQLEATNDLATASGNGNAWTVIAGVTFAAPGTASFPVALPYLALRVNVTALVGGSAASGIYPGITPLSAPPGSVVLNPQLTGIPLAVSGGVKRADSGQLLACGNSYVVGQGASSTAKRFSSIFAAAMGWTETNIAVSGVCEFEVFGAQVGSRVINAGDNAVLTSGLNDIRYYGPAPDKLAQYLEQLRALLWYLAVPDANKVFTQIPGTGPNPALTLSGTWVESTVFVGNTGGSRMGLYTTALNGSLTATVPAGDSVGVIVGQLFGVSGSFQLLIDGVSYGNGAISTRPLVDCPNNAGNWMPQLVLVSGLPNTGAPRTVQVVRTGATSGDNNVLIGCIAGYDSKTLMGGNVYCNDIPYLNAAGWGGVPLKNSVAQAVTDGQSSYLYEKNSAYTWNARIKAECDALKAGGLNVNYVALSRAANMLAPAADNVHMADPQHWHTAQANIAAASA